MEQDKVNILCLRDTEPGHMAATDDGLMDLMHRKRTTAILNTIVAHSLLHFKYMQTHWLPPRAHTQAKRRRSMNGPEQEAAKVSGV